MILGDLNRHMGDMIEGNDNDKISFGGQMIRDFTESDKYILVNATKKVIGGPFTRYEPSDPENDAKKSVFSLCIVSCELFEYIESLTIDKDKNITPYRTLSKNKKTSTDHYTMIVLFKNIPLKLAKTVGCHKVIRWNTNKEGGWKAYKQMTSCNAVLEEIANDTSEDTNKIMVKMDKELDKLKFQAFGKVKEKSRDSMCKELDKLVKEKDKLLDDKDHDVTKMKVVEDKISATLLKKQREAFEKELKGLKEIKLNKGKSAAIFKLKDKIVGPKTAAQEATVLMDPKNGTEVVTPAEIKRVLLQYCKDLLTNRNAKEEYKEDIFLKDMMHAVRMEEIIEDDISELSLVRFNSTFTKLTKKPVSKYDFIVKGGQVLKAALFRLCQLVWRTEALPDRWERSTLVQLYKGSGSRNVLDNMRHIHMKDEVPKFFGDLVVSASKEEMIANMTKYQIGTKPGHRAQEHLFVLKSVIALYMVCDKAIILSMWDVSKFFDRESLTDCMNELYRSKIQGKVYRLLYKMNKNTITRLPGAVP